MLQTLKERLQGTERYFGVSDHIKDVENPPFKFFDGTKPVYGQKYYLTLEHIMSNDDFVMIFRHLREEDIDRYNLLVYPEYMDEALPVVERKPNA